jgi:hypothetical protein
MESSRCCVGGLACRQKIIATTASTALVTFMTLLGSLPRTTQTPSRRSTLNNRIPNARFGRALAKSPVWNLAALRLSRVRIDLACDVCRGNRFAFPDGGDEDAIVTCDDCGNAVGTLRSLREQIERAILFQTKRQEQPS